MIPEQFHKYGRDYKLVKRDGRAVMYVITRKGVLVGWEVMVVQNRKESVLGGKVFPAGEALPSSSLWGVFGWSYSDGGLDLCEARYAKVCKHFNPQPVRRVVRRVRKVVRVRR
jgi:hypothetical protein